MNDLTKFNFKSHGYFIDIETNRHDIDDYTFNVVIFNFNEGCAFRHTLELTYGGAINLKDKIYARGVVNLTIWDTSDFLNYTTEVDYFGEGINGGEPMDEEMPLSELLKTEFGQQF